MALLAPASIQMGQSPEEKLDTGRAVRKVAGILIQMEKGEECCCRMLWHRVWKHVIINRLVGVLWL